MNRTKKTIECQFAVNDLPTDEETDFTPDAGTHTHTHTHTHTQRERDIKRERRRERL